MLVFQNNETLWKSGLAELVRLYFSENESVSGQTQKEEARKIGAVIGKLEGLRSGIAVLLTIRRGELLPHLSQVPGVGAYDTMGILNHMKTEYEEAPREDRELLFGNTLSSLEELALSDDLWKQHEAVRKDLVLEGAIEPDVSDRDWLKAELAAREAEAKRLGGFLGKLEEV
jgi:hypothetical protein